MQINLSAKLLNIIVLVGLIVGWVLALAGIAQVEHLCVSAASSSSSSSSSSSGSGLSAADTAALLASLSGRKLMASADGESVARGRALLSAVGSCGMQYSLWWWTIFFELLNIVLAALLLFNIPSAIRSFQSMIHTFFTIATVLLCLQAYAFVPAAQAAQSGGGSYYAAMAVISAGTVILLIFNFLWIIFNQTGLGDGSRVHSEEASPK